MNLDWEIDAASILTNSELKIPESHLFRVCRRGGGKSACRYIALTPALGHICVKNTPLNKYIDIEVNSNPNWRAKGNNCDGFGIYGKQQKEPEVKECERKENCEKDNPPTTKSDGCSS